MLYKFKYKRRFFWRSLKIDGHRLDDKLNRMDLFMPDGSVLSLGNWSECDLRLGADWVIRQKKDMEKQAGQDVKLNKGE